MKVRRLLPVALLGVSLALTPAAATAAPPTDTDHGAAVEVAPSGGDDTSLLQQRINEAAAQGIGVRLRPGARYLTSRELVLPPGLKAFDGEGALVEAHVGVPKGSDAANVFRFKAQSKGIILTEVRIDLKGSAARTRAVLAPWVSDTTISHLTITNLKFRGIDVVADDGPVDKVSIHDNVVHGAAGWDETEGVVGIAVTSHPEPDPFTGYPAPAYMRFRETGTVLPPRNKTSRITIVDNKVDTTYYGISLSGATDCLIARNVTTTNVRNLSIQDGSSRNRVRSNDFHDSTSAAIHVAYGSSDNLVEHNRIRTGRGKGGEALLQAYHNSTGNVFKKNRVEAHGSRVPRWFLYVATGSHNTVFHDNTLIGKASHAVAAAESIWDQRSATSAGLNPNPYSYSGRPTIHQGTGKEVLFAGGHGDLRGITFTENTFATEGQPFYLGAEVTYGPADKAPAVGNIVDIHISGNKLRSPGPTPIIEHRGQLDGVGQASISHRR